MLFRLDAATDISPTRLIFIEEVSYPNGEVRLRERLRNQFNAGVGPALMYDRITCISQIVLEMSAMGAKRSFASLSRNFSLAPKQGQTALSTRAKVCGSRALHRRSRLRDIALPPMGGT